MEFFTDDTDDISRLGSSQRAKLQYHILAQRFPLVAVSGEDAQELEQFAAQSDTETAQRWLNRMQWIDGHEKMVTFGQALQVPGNVRGLWCYSAKLEEKQATYKGIPMSWEWWAREIQFAMDMQLVRRCAQNTIVETAMQSLYYQHGHYLTVPQVERKAVVKWIYQYIKNQATPFPLQGDMGSEEYTFTIDFDRDTALKENVAIGEDMAAYNREQNAAKGQRRTEKLFATVHGDEWTTAQLLTQGFSKSNIKTFEKNGLIKRRYQGHYMRVSK